MKFDKNAPLYTNHAKSQELFTRALKVVPCGIYTKINNIFIFIKC